MEKRGDGVAQAPSTGQTQFTRDTTKGWVLTQKDPLGRTTTYVRDSSGYPTTVTYADGSTTRSQYQTAFHALTTFTNERGNNTVYGYETQKVSDTDNS